MPCSYVYLFVIGGEGPGQRSGGRFGYVGSLSPHLDPLLGAFWSSFWLFWQSEPHLEPKGGQGPKSVTFY